NVTGVQTCALPICSVSGPEPHLYLFHAAREYEGRDRHRLAFRIQPVRSERGRSVFRPDGALYSFHGQRGGDRRTARLLRHGEESRVLQRRRVRAPALAYACGGHRGPRPLRHAHDAYAVSPTGDLYRNEPHPFYGAFGCLAVR